MAPEKVIIFCFYFSYLVLLCSPTEARPSSNPGSGSSSGDTFSVGTYGAAGDGVTDDSKALLAAWSAACSVPSATIEIPSHMVLLIAGPITLQGPCKPNLVLQIDGTILGPDDISNWPGSQLLQWINLISLSDFTIQGSGTVNGRGSVWWRGSRGGGGLRPTAIRLYGSQNVVVQDITISNSPQCHLKFDGCDGVTVTKVTITSPANSPNTDGIHLQDTTNVEITDCSIACGDDCISIQTGCSGVHIQGIQCGPGHGISVGGLGRGNSYACVANITVEASSMRETQNGVRVKTWPGGKGFVSGLTFSGITMTNVDFPIVVDQKYCNGGHSCGSSSGDAIAVSDVTFSGITGTYAVQPVYFDCSDSHPCGVRLSHVHLTPAPGGNNGQSLCQNAVGESEGPLFPDGIDCFTKGASKSNSSPSQCVPAQRP